MDGNKWEKNWSNIYIDYKYWLVIVNWYAIPTFN